MFSYEKYDINANAAVQNIRKNLLSLCLKEKIEMLYEKNEKIFPEYCFRGIHRVAHKKRPKLWW